MILPNYGVQGAEQGAKLVNQIEQARIAQQTAMADQANNLRINYMQQASDPKVANQVYVDPASGQAFPMTQFLQQQFDQGLNQVTPRNNTFLDAQGRPRPNVYRTGGEHPEWTAKQDEVRATNNIQFFNEIKKYAADPGHPLNSYAKDLVGANPAPETPEYDAARAALYGPNQNIPFRQSQEYVPMLMTPGSKVGPQVKKWSNWRP